MKKLLLVLMVLAVPAHAANTYYEASADGSATSISVSSVVIPAGGLIVVGTRHSSDTGLPTITDDNGDTFTGICQADISGSGGDAVEVYYAYNASSDASSTITATWLNAQNFKKIMVHVYDTAITTNPLDQSGCNRQSAAASITSAAFTTTQADEVLTAFAGTGSTTATYTADTGYTLRSSTGTKDGNSEDQTVAAIQTGVTVSMSADETVNWGFGFATFKLQGGGGGSNLVIFHQVIQ